MRGNELFQPAPERLDHDVGGLVPHRDFRLGPNDLERAWPQAPRRLRIVGDPAREHDGIELQRIQLARELHDDVAHTISVMTLQAAGARRMMDRDPARAAQAIAAMEELGRAALGEIRQLLSVLTSDGVQIGVDGRPGLAELPSLIGQARRLGVRLELRVEGAVRQLTESVDVCAYRIVQEAVTNIVKHAGECDAMVAVTYGEEQLQLMVENGPSSLPEGLARHGEGRGLQGMRERVACCDGALEAGPLRDGGYRVHVRLSLQR
jgi:signal transduction histidine kinase